MYISGVRMVTISRENDLVGYNDVDIVDDAGDEMTVGKGDVAADEEAGVVVVAAPLAAVPLPLLPHVGSGDTEVAVEAAAATVGPLLLPTPPPPPAVDL